MNISKRSRKNKFRDLQGFTDSPEISIQLIAFQNSLAGFFVQIRKTILPHGLQFLQNLRNQGMQPVLMGDFPAGDDPRPNSSRRGRPYLVK